MGNYIVKPPSIDSTPLISRPILETMETENEYLRVFNLADLKKATNKFRQGKVITSEYGYVQTFYKGYIDETTFAPSRSGTGIAVSVMERDQDSSAAVQEWKEEVKSLGQLSHPNLVKLLGYCCKDNRSFFVFKYMHKESLDGHIFGKEEALPWEIRVKIAIGVAKVLAFLHSIKNSAIYPRMSNILLDEQYDAKMFYFGSNKLCLLEQDITFIGRTEYIPPEYINTGHLGTKSDVYTFGLILLELLTGMKALDGGKNKKNSVIWTTPFLSHENEILKIIDPRLGNDYPVNAVIQMGKLIKRWIEFVQRKRPSMQQVLDDLREIAEIKD